MIAAGGGDAAVAAVGMVGMTAGMPAAYIFHLCLWAASGTVAYVAFIFALCCVWCGARGADGLETMAYRALRFWGTGAVVLFVLAVVW